MSDFLTRLVTATYQPAATVRPRPVAHYEAATVLPPRGIEDEAPPPAPVAAPSHQAPVAPVSVLAHAPAPPAMPPAPAAPPLRSMAPASPQPVAPPKAVVPLATPSPKPIQPAALPPPVVAAETPAPRPIAQPLAHAPIPPSPLPAITVSPRLAQREDVNQRADEPRLAPPTLMQAVTTPVVIQVVAQAGDSQPAPPPLPAPLPAGAPVSAPRPTLAVVQTAAPLPVPFLAVQPEVQSPVATPARPADALAPRPHPQSSPPPLGALPAITSPTAPAPPVIRVTIGRIVIKAEGGKPSKPAKPHPAPTKPGLSLDAYLKRRGGGDA